MSEPQDDLTEPTDPGCPGDICSSQGIWQDLVPVGNGWGAGHLEARIEQVQLLSIPHDPQFRRIKCTMKVRSDGAQVNGLFFRACLCRRIDHWPDAFIKTKDLATNGDPGTWQMSVSRVARNVSTSWRYYGRVECWIPGEDTRAGYLNGPVSPAWDWLED